VLRGDSVEISGGSLQEILRRVPGGENREFVTSILFIPSLKFIPTREPQHRFTTFVGPVSSKIIYWGLGSMIGELCRR